ncbi:MAG TPA: SIS domain-containing protein [Candidatus Obscuribacterales bacterium]
MIYVTHHVSGTQDAQALRDAILRKSRESARTSVDFFQDNAERIQSLACAMSERFAQGGRLFVMGNGGSSCDAEHVAVEFMHPILEKRKALPSISLSAGSALLTAISNDHDFSRVYAVQLRNLAQSKDMVLAISTSGTSPNLVYALQEAKKLGLLTAAFCGKDGGRVKDVADWSLIVPSFSIHRIQETHVVLLHVLWDTIHLVMGEEDIV